MQTIRQIKGRAFSKQTKKGAIEMDGVIVRGNFNGTVKEVRVRNCDDNQSESSATNDKVKPCE